eukprot:gene116-167_t
MADNHLATYYFKQAHLQQLSERGSSRQEYLSKVFDPLVSTVVSLEPEECPSKIRQRWYTIFRTLRNKFVQREVFPCRYSRLCRSQSHWRPEDYGDKSHLEQTCTYNNLEISKLDFCKSLFAAQDSGSVFKLVVSIDFDEVYAHFANDKSYLKKLIDVSLDREVTLPPSLKFEEAHFELREEKNGNLRTVNVTDVPLAWPLSIYADSAQANPIYSESVTPFDIFVAFLGYLVYLKKNNAKLLCDKGVLVEDVIESVSMFSRVKVSLIDKSFGELLEHEGDMDYEVNFSLTPTSLGQVHAASFIHVCDHKNGVPILMDLILWNTQSEVLFRTSCFPIFGYGFVMSPLRLNYLRVETLNEMYVSADVEQRRKAEETAYAIFAYGGELGIGKRFFDDKWDSDSYDTDDSDDSYEPRVWAVEKFYDDIPQHEGYGNFVLESEAVDLSSRSEHEQQDDPNDRESEDRLVHDVFSTFSSDSEC